TITCTVTGNGFKDTATALGDRTVEPQVIPVDVEAAAAALGL
ncbi:MAG: threonine synthase, partial [Demequina sp.]|nr:threonine synthase [Demequina sp.]